MLRTQSCPLCCQEVAGHLRMHISSSRLTTNAAPRCIFYPPKAFEHNLMIKCQGYSTPLSLLHAFVLFHRSSPWTLHSLARDRCLYLASVLFTTVHSRYSCYTERQYKAVLRARARPYAYFALVNHYKVYAVCLFLPILDVSILLRVLVHS